MSFARESAPRAPPCITQSGRRRAIQVNRRSRSLKSRPPHTKIASIGYLGSTRRQVWSNVYRLNTSLMAFSNHLESASSEPDTYLISDARRRHPSQSSRMIFSSSFRCSRASFRYSTALAVLLNWLHLVHRLAGHADDQACAAQHLHPLLVAGKCVEKLCELHKHVDYLSLLCDGLWNDIVLVSHLTLSNLERNSSIGRVNRHGHSPSLAAL